MANSVRVAQPIRLQHLHLCTSKILHYQSIKRIVVFLAQLRTILKCFFFANDMKNNRSQKTDRKTDRVYVILFS